MKASADEAAAADAKKGRQRGNSPYADVIFAVAGSSYMGLFLSTASSYLLHKRENLRSIALKPVASRVNGRNIMRLAILAAAALCAAGAAAAEPAQAPRNDTAAAKQGGRVVLVCDTSAETMRDLRREYGKVTFVSAADLARAQASKETWTKPRCITEAELQRFEIGKERLLQARAD